MSEFKSAYQSHRSAARITARVTPEKKVHSLITEIGGGI